MLTKAPMKKIIINLKIQVTERMQNSSQNSGMSNSSDYRSNKGTGMSSESGSCQSEKSWQGYRRQPIRFKHKVSGNSGGMSNSGNQGLGSGQSGLGSGVSNSGYTGNSSNSGSQNKGSGGMNNSNKSDMNDENDSGDNGNNKDWNKAVSRINRRKLVFRCFSYKPLLKSKGFF